MRKRTKNLNFSSETVHMKILDSPLKQHYAEVFTLVFFTVLGIVNQDVTAFYVIYLFWCQEFLKIIFSAFFLAFTKPETYGPFAILGNMFAAFFPMFVYLVFIVVLFVFMLDFQNEDIGAVNLKTMVFRNKFFNINLLIFSIQTLIYYYLNRYTVDFSVYVKLFNPGQLILHISIILGAVMKMVILENFTEYFTPKNLWGSVLVILPFLLLKALLPENYLKNILVTKNED